MTYRLIEETDAYEVGERNGELTAGCVCGSGVTAPNKGLGRAMVAAWKTRHQSCTTDPRATAREAGGES